jgi:hypothetical protein
VLLPICAGVRYALDRHRLLPARVDVTMPNPMQAIDVCAEQWRREILQIP